ncbi:MAG TPA: LysM peptidoglycan-binding domain-containing protein [Anaerolineae bacterium]|nr:LysM peptidoglycan-binding domain-containing protein [Anaerolineae bacterium]
MKTGSRAILIAALLMLSIIVVLPVSAGNSATSAAFQSPIDTPTSAPATSTPIPPATDTPIPAATDTPIPAATNTPVPAATNTPIPAITNTPMPAATSTPWPTYIPPYPPPYPPPPPPVYQIIGYWTVQPGQTLYCIGRYYKVSPWAIASTNYVPWPYYIYPGQVLAIPNAPWYNIPPGPVCYPGVPNVTPTPPSGATPTPPPAITPTPPVPPACRYYHYVLWGQTLSGIAWYYGTTIQAIMYANPSIYNPNLIYAGSTLCIP